MSLSSIYQRTASYIRRNGLKETVYAGADRLSEMCADIRYNGSVRKVDSRELERQKKQTFERSVKFSILVPAFDPDPVFFRQMMESVLAQSYENFELIIADGGMKDDLRRMSVHFADTRIKYRRLDPGGGISANTNAALAEASGDYVTLMDHDDFIEPDALYETVRAVQNGADIVYTDEDKYDTASGRYLSPYRKSGYNRELLLSNNYICHMFTVRKDIADSTGGFDSSFDGAQDYDFILKCIEKTQPSKIAHVHEILYHWRIHAGSTSGNPESKLYAYEAGKRVLEAYLERNELSGHVSDTPHRGFYRIDYDNPCDAGEYLIMTDGTLKAPEGYERKLASYFARNDIGAVGGRITDSRGRIICNGYHRCSDGSIRSYYEGMDTHFTGHMHRASLQQDVPAVSDRACMIRKELIGCMDPDPYTMFKNIRRRGYAVVLDPTVVFRENRNE